MYKQDSQIIKTKTQTTNKSNINHIVDNLLDELESKIDNLPTEGSGWKIKRFNKILIESFTTKVARGSSYIPTPAPYNNPKCGLINIKNDDQECFKWCLKYHQSNKSKNDDRLSVFK
jgi:hypothetical protein